MKPPRPPPWEQLLQCLSLHTHRFLMTLALCYSTVQLQGRKRDILLVHQLPTPISIHYSLKDDTQPLREHRVSTEGHCAGTFSYQNIMDSSFGLCPKPQDSPPLTLFPFPMKSCPLLLTFISSRQICMLFVSQPFHCQCPTLICAILLIHKPPNLMDEEAEAQSPG